MAAIIGILTVLATVTADSSATINHAIGLRSGTIDYAPKIATSMRAVDPAQFSWYRCFNEVTDYPELLAQTTGAAAKGPETDPEADSGMIGDPYHDYNDAAVSLTVQSSTACTAGAPATRASSRTTSRARHQFSMDRGLSNEPKYPDHNHYCDGNDDERVPSSNSSSAANSEDKVRVECLGRKQRGRVGDPPFNHNTGKGYIEGAKGYYHDALVNKKNKVNVLLHNTFGGFSPPAASKIRRMGATAKGGTDRTRYADRRRLSYVTHHTRRIATAIIKNDAYAINAQARHLKTVLYDHRLGDGHEHSRADDAAF